MKKWLIVIIIMLLVYNIILTYNNNSGLNNLYDDDEKLNPNDTGILVLNYHRIRNSNPVTKILDRWTTFFTKDSELMLYSIYEDEFKEQIIYLLDNGYHFITPIDLKNYLSDEKSISEKSVLITFDDVDISIYENAFPFLVEKQIPFTIFVITGQVGNKNFKGLKLATWDQIREMYNSELVTVGAHTHNMHKLDKENNPPFMYNTKNKDFIQDTKLSINTIKKEIGITPTNYAYPYGFGIAETDEVLLDLGYELIYSLKPGAVKKDDQSFFIKRILISRYSWESVVDWVENNK